MLVCGCPPVSASVCRWLNCVFRVIAALAISLPLNLQHWQDNRVCLWLLHTHNVCLSLNKNATTQYELLLTVMQSFSIHTSSILSVGCNIHLMMHIETSSVILPAVIGYFRSFNLRQRCPGDPTRSDQFAACVQEALAHCLSLFPSIMTLFLLPLLPLNISWWLFCCVHKWCPGACKLCIVIFQQSPSPTLQLACTVHSNTIGYSYTS